MGIFGFGKPKIRIDKDLRKKIKSRFYHLNFYIEDSNNPSSISYGLKALYNICDPHYLEFGVEDRFSKSPRNLRDIIAQKSHEVSFYIKDRLLKSEFPTLRRLFGEIKVSTQRDVPELFEAIQEAEKIFKKLANEMEGISKKAKSGDYDTPESLRELKNKVGGLLKDMQTALEFIKFVQRLYKANFK